MVKFFQGGKKEASKYTKCSGQKIHPICPDCNKVSTHKVSISNINKNKGFQCECSDEISYPEKFLINILNQLKEKFIRQYILKCETHDKIRASKYDFYIPRLNLIIEVHGLQHYRYTGRGCSLKEQQEIDEKKKTKALNDDMVIYIVIDARISDMEYIKESILKSELVKYFNFNTVNWSEADEYGVHNIVKSNCEFFENNKDKLLMSQIIKELNISHGVLLGHLRKGNLYGWCNYDKNYMNKLSSEKCHRNMKKIKCIETNEIYLSIKNCANELEKIYDLDFNKNNISKSAKTGVAYKGFHFEFIEGEEEDLCQQ